MTEEVEIKRLTDMFNRLQDDIDNIKSDIRSITTNASGTVISPAPVSNKHTSLSNVTENQHHSRDHTSRHAPTGADALLIDDDTLAGESDTLAATQGNVKTYADTQDALQVSIADIDDVPVDGIINAPISSNWAFDHAASPTDIKHLTDIQLAALHAIYVHPTADINHLTDAQLAALHAIYVHPTSDGYQHLTDAEYTALHAIYVHPTADINHLTDAEYAALHAKYTNAEAVDAVEAVGVAAPVAADWFIYSDAGVLKRALISGIDETILTAIKTYIDGLDHHSKYTDAEALTQAQSLDHDHATPINSHAGNASIHHAKYTSVEAVDAVEAVGVAVPIAGDWFIYSDAGVLKRALISGIDETILTAIKTYIDAQTHTDANWSAATVGQAEAEAGIATTDRKWTAQRVKQAIDALESKWHENLVESSDWTIGSGSVGKFSQNGLTSENSRVYGITPHDTRGILWKGEADAGNDADGGWITDYFSVDHTKTYRFTVWIKKTVTANGSTYLGCNATGDILNLGGGVNGNPYFWSGDLPVLDRWYLIVGYVYGSGSTYTTNKGGIYDGTTGKKVSTITAFRMSTNVTALRHRSYLYYDTSATAIQYWFDPRMEEVNGSEMSLMALLPASVFDNYSEGAHTTNTWRGIDDVPVNGQLSESITSNWAYDHEAGSFHLGGAGAILDDFLLYYSTQWFPLVLEGDNVGYGTNRGTRIYGYAAGNNGIWSFMCKLPLVYGNYKLVITGFKYYIYAADGSDYVSRTAVYQVYGSTINVKYDDTSNQTTAGLKQDGSGSLSSLVDFDAQVGSNLTAIMLHIFVTTATNYQLQIVGAEMSGYYTVIP